MRRLLLLSLLVPGLAWAKKPVIYGAVVDRNGEPVARVNVKLTPGNVEIITDETGKFVIDYLRDDEGNRIKLTKKTDYAIEYFKVGFHPETAEFYFKRGELFLDPATLKEDTIAVKTSSDNIDPGQYPDRAQSAGGSYEGE
jgi:hypothetical protein